MPWFKVDDSAHSHPKLRKAGTAAAGLWMLGGSYAAQYLTDGIVHAHFIKPIGTPTQTAKLVRVGLWHPAGHACPRCAQPPDGDYIMHDYLAYNFSRARVLADRDRAAEKKRKQRSGQESDPKSTPNRTPNGSRIAPESDPKKSGDPDETAGHSDASPGDSPGYRARASQPIPSHASPTEMQASKTAGPNVPAFATDLVTQMTAAGMVVGWRLGETEWFAVHAHIKRCGIDTMVDFARRRWNPDDPPQTARYLTRIWSDLPDIPEPATGLPALRAIEGPAAPTSRQQQETDAWFERAMTRAQARDQQEAS